MRDREQLLWFGVVGSFIKTNNSAYVCIICAYACIIYMNVQFVETWGSMYLTSSLFAILQWKSSNSAGLMEHADFYVSEYCMCL